jgi:2-polyprenyl-3-methyl-5-hydroxy-6-metoxy-1,4-benzoquinol methylase
LDSRPTVQFVRRLLTRNTDHDWQYYGAVDSYFGVLTREEYRAERLDDVARAALLATGERHNAAVFAAIHDHLDPSFSPKRVLDFGCGVGRLTLPLAKVCESVVGVDVSAGMLAEASRNAERCGLSNITFCQSDDSLSSVNGRFDLIHSFIVFQHIPRDRGERIVAGLLDRLEDGGIGVLQFTYAHSSLNPPSWPRRVLTMAYAKVPLIYAARNLAKGERVRRPPMQMNLYDLNRLIRLLQEHGCHEVHLRFTETSHYNSDVYGVILFFAKRQRDLSEGLHLEGADPASRSQT